MRKYIGKVKEAYNETHFGGFGDLIESLLQKLSHQEAFDDVVNILTLGLFETSHERNLETQVNAYKDSIKSGHKVLVVAHSQGNLFTYEARGRLIDESKDAWMDKYFQVISIASPAMFSISIDTPLISWDNDVVAWLGIYNSSMVPNDVRKVGWERISGEIASSIKPPTSYIRKSQRNDILNTDWKPSEKYIDYSANGSGAIGFVDDKVHAFTFYMGEDLADGKILNPFDGSKLHTDKAKTLIMNAVDEKITYLENLDSQWKPKKEIGCVCKKKYIEVTHQFDPSEMDKLLKGQDIKNFSDEGEGKIYTVEDTYVRAGYGGESIEKLDEGEVCLRLKSSNATLGEIKGKRQGDIPKAFNGAIDMYLTWNYECDIDMNLEMTASPNSRGAPYIRQDIKDIEGYGKEHTYIDTVYHTYPGDHYNFEADGEKLPDSTLDEETLAKAPIEIRALLETPTGSYIKVWEAKSFNQLDLGKFAELDVKEKIIPQWICPALNNAPGWYRPFNGDTKRFQCVSCEKPYTVEWYKPNPKRAGYWKCNRPVVYPNYTSSGRTYNQCTEKEKKKTCGCVPCEYIVSGMQKRVENGPIAGADVTIIKASELSSVSPTTLWKGKTTDKEDIFKSGLLEIPFDTLQNFEDDVYYVVMAKGGNDIDYDDDMKRDISPVENHGVMHAIIKGSELKQLPFRVNVLTEAIYQVMGEYMGDNYRQTALEENLDVLARKILSKKLYPADDEPIINYKDVLLWTPAVDKKALYKPYNIYVEPIVKRVYADEERYDVSYRFVYEPYSSDAPQLSPVTLEIPAGLPDGTIIASLTTQNEKAFTSVELEGTYAEHFNMDDKGYLHINKSELIKVGNKYRLQVRAVDGLGNKGGFVSLDISVLVPSNIVDPTKSVPMFVSADVNAIYENSEAGTVVAQTYFGDSNQTIVAYRLIGEDNSSFTIDDNGVIYVAQNATIDYEKSKLYSFKVAAKNDVGNESFPVRLSVPIKNRLDTPLFDLVVFEHIEENIPLGTVITTIRTDRVGLGAIDKFEILSPHMPFTIDSNGTMYVSNYIDYEQKKQYDFYAIARTKYGNSNKIEIHIVVDDQRPEVGVPSLEALTLSVDENITSGSKIGQLVLDTGATAIERIALYGEDDSFRVDANGSIYLADDATLDFETKTRYDLGARALNSRGWGNEVHIVIHVNNIADELPTLENFRKSVEENATAGTEIGKIITSGTSETAIDSFELTGTGNENFTIDVNGTIRVSQSAQLDYESKNSYLLQAIASSTVGSSAEVEVIIYILNVPENPPVLKPLTLNIEENASIGTVVGTVEEDIGGDSPIISYRLDDNSTFSVNDKGELYLIKPLHYHTKKVYTLGLYALNSKGESQRAEVSISVEANDIIKPVISLKGASKIYHAEHTPYLDLGALAYDDIEGDISNHIVVTNPVDVEAAVGTSFIVQYNVSDGQGNHAQTVERLVIIIRELNTNLENWKANGEGTWVLKNANKSVLQTINGQPTVFHNNVDSQNDIFSLNGKISVKTTEDDDFIGFVLGYHDGDLYQNNVNYLLIDWKQGNQSGASKGLALSRVSKNISKGAWLHNSTTGIQELQRGKTLGYVGWKDNTSYLFNIKFTASNVLVYINNNLELNMTGTFNDGAYGFYNYSQSSVEYAAIEANSESGEKPSANAGLDQSILLGSALILDASLSTDDGEIISYIWEEEGKLLGIGIMPTIWNLEEGTHTITLTIIDDEGNSVQDTVVVIVDGI